MKRKGLKVSQNTITLMFLVICIIGIILSGYSPSFLVNQVVIRFARNAFLVLSLLLPVVAGLGINFGMTLGAMAGQLALILVEDWGVVGIPGILLASLISIPFAWLLGSFAGGVLNRAKGREMITSMILSFFISGVYQFIVLYMFGTIIPIRNPNILLSRGYGVRNALELSVYGGFDKFFDKLLGTDISILGVQIPILSIIVIILGCLFIVWFKKTKIGQDMRAVGQDMEVSEASGINVNRVRRQAMVLSTIMASFGQIIYLQNIGNLNTYNGADQAATYAAAALLIGGASVSKASISNALLGTLLFHTMFIVMPQAGTNVTGNAMLGEYFRTFISYAIVTITLILHSIRRNQERSAELELIRNHQ